MAPSRTYTDKYTDVYAEASRLRDTNCCALIAVAVLTGKSYEDVYDLFRAKGRRRGKGTYGYITRSVLRDLGYTLERLKRLPKTVNQCEAKLSKRGRFLIHTSRHALAMKNGKVHDHSRGSRRRPKEIYRVVRKRS